MDSVHGAEVSTEKVWEAAEEIGLPRIIALNRLDRERASLDRSLESLRGVFGRAVIPIQLPIGDEKNFAGVVDLVSMKACMFASDGSGKPVDGAVPGNMMGTAEAAREALIEMVAEADDALMEKFFETGTLEEIGRRTTQSDDRRPAVLVVDLSAGRDRRDPARARP